MIFNFNYKDWFHWVNLLAIYIIGSLYFFSLSTLQEWSWGYWSYKYFVTMAIAFTYFMYYWFITQSRRLGRIEQLLTQIKGDTNNG